MLHTTMIVNKSVMTISIAVKKEFISRASPENKPFYTAIPIVFLSEIKIYLYWPWHFHTRRREDLVAYVEKSLEKPTITSKLRDVITAMWHPKAPTPADARFRI